ncbi:hypothetical protein HSB1_42490 [Halogranum salarium B-1]|uniref:Uncharacterized protein n=2 Tax=Halogranum rubrum TaxID=553466 RepID=J3JD93_9EURY|nr:hypothetical protein HSB1_42490 [Halogranum salarium B-1]
MVLIRFSIDKDHASNPNSYEIVIKSNTDIWFRSEYDDANYERLRQFLQTLATGEDVRNVRAASDYYREDRLLSMI